MPAIVIWKEFVFINKNKITPRICNNASEIFCRYNEIFFMIDTCQAASMYERFYSPNILAVGSSLVGEDSLSVSIHNIKTYRRCEK